jgi:hypothetical protein
MEPATSGCSAKDPYDINVVRQDNLPDSVSSPPPRVVPARFHLFRL